MHCMCADPVLLLTESIYSCTWPDHTCSIGKGSRESAEGVCHAMQAAEVRVTEVCGFDMSAVNRHRWHPGHTAGLSVRPSVRSSVRLAVPESLCLSVRPSVRPSVCLWHVFSQWQGQPACITSFALSCINVSQKSPDHAKPLYCSDSM